MHWSLVDGVQMPNLVGGHPALDFCNTWAGWGELPNAHHEWVPDYERLVVWAAWAGLIDRPTAGRLRRRFARQPDASELVDRAHALRASLYGYLTERRGRRARASALAQAVEAAADARRFRVGLQDGRWELPENLELPLQATALAIADLLAGGDLGRIGRCPGHDCGWLFVSHRARRWCSMASCGNRAKVRAHAARQRDRSLRRDESVHR